MWITYTLNPYAEQLQQGLGFYEVYLSSDTSGASLNDRVDSDGLYSFGPDSFHYRRWAHDNDEAIAKATAFRQRLIEAGFGLSHPAEEPTND